MADTYIDSRGAEMEPMSFADALAIAMDLAASNQLADRHIRTDPNLAEMRDW